MNNLLSLTSPDSRATGYTYDAAGNRATQTDARGVVSTYNYALNGLAQIAYPTPSLNVTYGYDESDGISGCERSYSIGRLTSMTDSSGLRAYCYDRRGNVLGKTQMTYGAVLQTQYSYNFKKSRVCGLHGASLSARFWN